MAYFLIKQLTRKLRIDIFQVQNMGRLEPDANEHIAPSTGGSAHHFSMKTIPDSS